MSKNKAPTRDIEAEMFALFQERGPMTETDLIRAGFSPEQITIHSPAVAARARETMPLAA